MSELVQIKGHDEGLEKTINWYLKNPEILNNNSDALQATPWKNSN